VAVGVRIEEEARDTLERHEEPEHDQSRPTFLGRLKAALAA
jgi:hypothetical protein